MLICGGNRAGGEATWNVRWNHCQVQTRKSSLEKKQNGAPGHLEVTHRLLVRKQSSAHGLGVGAVGGLGPGHGRVFGAAVLSGGVALGQGPVAGVGEGTGGGRHGHARTPGALELSVAGCGRRVVRGRRGRQGRVEASYSFRVCEHAIHGWAAVYAASAHLAQSHDRTLVSKPFIGEELIWVLEKHNNNNTSVDYGNKTHVSII